MTDSAAPAPVLVTWFHADDAASAGSYSQIRGSAASAANYEVYLRCIDVCVASFRRWNPAGTALVVLNAAGEAAVGPQRVALWRRLQVRTSVVPNTHRPDVELFPEWQNQFFLFDVMRAGLAAAVDPTTPILVVDSDVVVRGSLDGLAQEVADAGRVRMRIPYREDEVANGSSRADLADFVTTLSGARPPFVPEYQGGEFVAATRERLVDLVDACDVVYRWSLDRQRTGASHPNEEAHMISVADPTPADSITGNRWIERIWTKPWNLRLLPEDPDSIPMWHLPAEKKTGFARLHAAVLAPSSWFWRAPAGPWSARLGRVLGVPRYGPAKLLQDLVALRSDVLPAVRERLARR